MEETRVQRYKTYRESIIKEDAIVLKTPSKTSNSSQTEILNTTSTLPISEVMDAMDGKEKEEQEAFLRERNKKKFLKILLIALISSVVVAGLVIFGIIAFGGK